MSDEAKKGAGDQTAGAGDGSSKETNGNGQSSPSSTPSGTGTGQDTPQDLIAVKKALDGLQTLIGKWGNEQGEIRAAMKELQSKLDGSKPTDKGGEAKTADKGNEVIEPMSETEKKAIDESWSKLTVEERAVVLKNAPGKTQAEKFDSIKSEFVKQIRENSVIVPDSLFAPDKPAEKKDEKAKAGDFAGIIYKAIAGADKMRHSPIASGAGHTLYTTSGPRKSNENTDDRRKSGSGGIMELISKK